MLMLGWGLAAVAGFVAAVLVAPSLFLSPPMMVSVVIYALAAATLGGSRPVMSRSRSARSRNNPGSAGTRFSRR